MLKTTLSLLALLFVVGVSRADDAKPIRDKAPVDCAKLSGSKQKVCIAKRDRESAAHDMRMNNESKPAGTPSAAAH